MVTGGAGFVGTSVTLALLARGDDVVVFDTGQACGFDHVERSGAEIVQADVGTRTAVEQAVAACDAVIHLAAQTRVPESIADPMGDFASNVTGSLTLLDAARQAGVERFVFASSNAVVAGHPPPVHEALPARPVSPYGAGKAAVEAYLRSYSAAYGMAGVALRFANAYGPFSAHKTSVIPSFVRAYLAGGPLPLRGDGRQTRDFVHVTDLVAAVLAALDAPAELIRGEVFQVASGREASLLELAALLFDVGGGEVPIEHLPPLAGDVPRNRSDVSHLTAVLGVMPRVELRDGLAGTLEWFRGRTAD